MVLTRRQNIWCYTAQHTTRRGGSHGQISTIKATQDAYGASWRGSGRWPVPPTRNDREREKDKMDQNGCPPLSCIYSTVLVVVIIGPRLCVRSRYCWHRLYMLQDVMKQIKLLLMTCYLIIRPTPMWHIISQQKSLCNAGQVSATWDFDWSISITTCWYPLRLTTNCNQTANVKDNHRDLCSVRAAFDNFLNPIQTGEDEDSRVFCLTPGQPASDAVSASERVSSFLMVSGNIWTSSRQRQCVKVLTNVYICTDPEIHCWQQGSLLPQRWKLQTDKQKQNW